MNSLKSVLQALKDRGTEPPSRKSLGPPGSGGATRGGGVGGTTAGSDGWNSVAGFNPRRTSARSSAGAISELRQMIEFGKKRFNLTLLKKRAYSHVPVKITKNFRHVLTSPEFDTFILSAAHYIRWYIQVIHLQKANQIAFVPPPVISNHRAGQSGSAGSAKSATTAAGNPGSAGSNKSRKSTLMSSEESLAAAAAATAAASSRRMSVRPIFVEDGGDTVELEIAIENRDEKLKELASAYCFLLLLTSRTTTEPARERAYFESIYAFTKEITTQLISLPNYNVTLETELNRLFRGNLFSGTNAQDSFKIATTSKKKVSIVAVSKDLWGNQAAVSGGIGVAGTASGVGGGVSGQVATGSGSRPTSGGGVLSQLANIGGRPNSGGGGLGGLAAMLAGGGGGGGAAVGLNKFKAKASILGKLSNLSKPAKVDIFAAALNPVETTDAGAPASAPSQPSGGGTSTPAVYPSVVGGVGGTESDKPPLPKTSTTSANLPPLRKQTIASSKKIRKSISLGDIRMARSPLADTILPPPQRFLFT
ncbi:UNVERIFIED_CONTAM: hypothetical protein HDU68_012389 [Siphonaria sp. JEL0065]|nr:hypothetical protein HDU68_012389 [Siphonaria sp. JEL0065]